MIRAISLCLTFFCITGSVASPLQVDSVRLDTPVDGAPVELVWIIDGATDSEFTYWGLKNALYSVLQGLSSKNIRHTSAVLSADYYWSKALPRPDSTGDPLLLSTSSRWTESMRERLNRCRVVGASFGSETWVLHQFFRQLPTLSYFPFSFGTPNVPMIALAVTNNEDFTVWEKKNTPYQEYDAEAFGQALVQSAKKRNQPFVFWAIGRRTKQKPLLDGCNTYDCFLKAAVESTGGKYFPVQHGFRMLDTLQVFVEQTALNAYVFAKRVISLSKMPKSPEEIAVRLRGILLTDTQWRYEPDGNKVVLDWTSIPVEVRPGDRLVISYPHVRN